MSIEVGCVQSASRDYLGKIAFSALSDNVLTNIVDDINRRGFGVATNCIDTDHLVSLRSFIENKVNDNRGEYVAFTGPEKVRGTFLENLSSSPEFIHACKVIYEKGTGKSAPHVPFYQVLRCLSGKTGEKHAFIFHYDSYVLTALVPIIIPTDGKRGDLVMHPNTRKIRKSYFSNLVDKVLLDNKLAQVFLKMFVSSGALQVTKVSLTPGNVYFFWGYRSIHMNEPCDPDKIRATALFHFVDPHADSSLRCSLRVRPKTY
jgi:hypothetical protein